MSDIKTKDFKTYRQQWKLLRKRGLDTSSITGEEYLKYNYYKLINGYKDWFLDKEAKKEVFLKGTKLIDIISLYEFDMDLSSIFSRYILECERHITSVFAYCSTEKIGPEGYLNFRNYQPSNKKDTINAISRILNTISKRDSVTTNHYLKKYNIVPFWVVINKMQLGEVKKIYDISIKEIQINVANHFIKNNAYDDSEKIKRFKTYFKSIYYARNKVSHNNRFFDIRDHKYKGRPEITISTLPIHEKLISKKIFKLGKRGICLRGVSDISALIFSIREILGSKKMRNLLIELDSLLKKSNFGVLKVSKIKDKMGLPKNIFEIHY